MQYLPSGHGDLEYTFGPEDVLGYVYGVLYSDVYRARYNHLLKSSFPHIPITRQFHLFQILARFGSRLISLHLMKYLPPNIIGVSLSGNGDNHVTNIPPRKSPLPLLPGKNDSAWGMLLINKQQSFQPVPQQVWDFKVGGYHICHKWLNYRKGRILTGKDVQHFINIILILNETAIIMAKIDRTIQKFGGFEKISQESKWNQGHLQF